MKQSVGSILVLAALFLAGPAAAGVQWPLEEGDAYSRVLCRDARDTEGTRKQTIQVAALSNGQGPTLSCMLENYEIVSENGLLDEKLIDIKRLVWGARENGKRPRRYFVLPEVCYEVNGTWRCRKQSHVKPNLFDIELPKTCPYMVKVGALPIVTTLVNNMTAAPLEPSGTMLLSNGEVSSNPFSFHPDLDIEGAYYRDLAIVWVHCPPQAVITTLCGDGRIEGFETCDDGNSINDDSCSNRCTPPSVDPYCGDGIIDPDEQCDDGNSINDDGCNNACAPPPLTPPPGCGDGIVQTALGETCEPGMTLAPVLGGTPDRACEANCTYCGDGFLDAGEECDDGNGSDDDNCRNDCTLPPVIPPPPPPEYRYCEMFRDPSFSRDQQGNVRLKANGRMEAIDASVAGPSDDLVVDLGNETVVVRASTPEEGVVFEREFPIGSLSYFERSGNHGWEHDEGNNDFMTLRINNNYSRFNLELPGDDRMDALLNKVEAGNVTQRLVEFQIRFEEERIICRAETWWDCKDTGQRGHCKGLLQ